MAQRWSTTTSSISWALQTTQTDHEFLEAGVDDFIPVKDEEEPIVPDVESSINRTLRRYKFVSNPLLCIVER